MYVSTEAPLKDVGILASSVRLEANERIPVSSEVWISPAKSTVIPSLTKKVRLSKYCSSPPSRDMVVRSSVCVNDPFKRKGSVRLSFHLGCYLNGCRARLMSNSLRGSCRRIQRRDLSNWSLGARKQLSKQRGLLGFVLGIRIHFREANQFECRVQTTVHPAPGDSWC